MAYKYIHFSPRSKHTKTINKFLGVDYSSQKFLVGDGRAIDLLNFIYKDGIIQKRKGFEMLYKVAPFTFYDVESKKLITNTINFNGIWRMSFEDKKVHTIAHIGKLLYEVKGFENGNLEFEPILYTTKKIEYEGSFYNQCFAYEDYKSSAFNGGDRLWFLGGNKYVLIRFLTSGELIVTPVEDSVFAPIPVTQISITYKNARASGRANLDKVNLLNLYRKNRLISGVGKKEDDKTKSDYFDYSLDAPLICKNQNKDMANFKIIIEERGKIE